MSLDPTLLTFGVIVTGAYAVQTVTGFGSGLLCVSIGALIMPIPEIITFAVPISLMQTGYIAARHRQDIRWSLLLKRVLPLMGIGMAVGFFGIKSVSGEWVRTVFGVLILVLSIRELVVLGLAAKREREREQSGDEAEGLKPIPLPASILALFGAGVIHGIYTTGGPLLVYAIGKEGLNKAEFRTTLCAVWLSLNLILMGAFTWEGRYDGDVLLALAALLPTVPLGIFIGEKLHARVPERTFKLAIFVLLIGAAISLIVR